MAEQDTCPNCKNQLNSCNRLITENCGHSKCRQCLISEENGCEQCLCKIPCIVKEKITIIEDKYLPANVSYIHTKEKLPRPGRTCFPSHIVKQCTDTKKVVYLCTICDKRFNSRTQQYYHLFCNNSSNKPYKCEQCVKTFSTSSHLKYHMDGHSKKSFSCSVCGKTFSKQQILRKHEKLHTTVAQECTECGAKLRDKVAFVAHMQKHQNIFPYSCNICEKKFSLKSTLRMHKTVHGGNKQYKCNLCDKKFDRNSTLKLHTLRHTKLKKYNCSECCKQFIDMKSLMRHSKIHVGTCKYKCTLCDTTSIRKDNITRHLRNIHPNESKNSIEVIYEEPETSESEKQTEVVSCEHLPVPSGSAYDANNSDVPKIVANSSVIRCIGNVQPVIIPQENQSEIKAMPPAIHPAAATHKKLKKKYDPHEIYRKILLDDDSTTENDTNSMNETAITQATDQTKLVQETTALCNGQQSNFSETHWRKNFKYTYQIQFD